MASGSGNPNAKLNLSPRKGEDREEEEQIPLQPKNKNAVLLSPTFLKPHLRNLTQMQPADGCADPNFLQKCYLSKFNEFLPDSAA